MKSSCSESSPFSSHSVPSLSPGREHLNEFIVPPSAPLVGVTAVSDFNWHSTNLLASNSSCIPVFLALMEVAQRLAGGSERLQMRSRVCFF